MAKRLDSRLQALEARIKPPPLVWLTREESAVIGVHCFRRLFRELKRRAASGEPPIESTPVREALIAELMAIVRELNDRVAELQRQGRLPSVIASLRTKGFSCDECEYQEPAFEIGTKAE